MTMVEDSTVQRMRNYRKNGLVKGVRTDSPTNMSWNWMDSTLSILPIPPNTVLWKWISILIRNRTFTIPIGSISEESRDYLIERHSLDLSNVDVIIGYRADDSYFSYAQSFLDNSMSLESLESAVMLGDLGKQVVLISEKAISRLRFIDSTSVDNQVYGPLYSERDSNTRDQLKKLKGKARNGKFILQIMEEGS